MSRAARPVVVVGTAVRLRAFSDADCLALERAFSDEAIARWNPGPAAPAEIMEWAAERNDWSAGTHASWAVADRNDDVVGSVSLHHIDREQADAEIGYWTAPWARGRGVATAAVQLATWFAHAQLRLNRVYLYHATGNGGSCRVADAAGYRLEGILKRSYRYADGNYHDEHLHAHLPDDAAIEPAQVQ